MKSDPVRFFVALTAPSFLSGWAFLYGEQQKHVERIVWFSVAVMFMFVPIVLLWLVGTGRLVMTRIPPRDVPDYLRRSWFGTIFGLMMSIGLCIPIPFMARQHEFDSEMLRAIDIIALLIGLTIFIIVRVVFSTLLQFQVMRRLKRLNMLP